MPKPAWRNFVVNQDGAGRMRWGASHLAKILVVDDEPLIAMLVEAWLSDMGHEPIGPAQSLSEAASLLDAAIDGAIIDLTLGEESGRPIAEALAAKGAPFVYATGQAETQLDDLPPAAGVLLKPYSFETFEAAVRVMLGPPALAKI
jgi:DNA-binding response OmpR family regulator